MTMGSYIAFRQNDLKALLAYSTISHLGMMVTLLGFGSEEGAIAAIFHVLNHAAFKASLFLAVGIIGHETGTQDLRLISGLWQKLPRTALLGTIAALSMAGVPLFNGFMSKELFLDATLHLQRGAFIAAIFPALAVLASIFTVAYSLRFVHRTFLGPEGRNLPKEPHEPPTIMHAPIWVLVIFCILIALWPQVFVEPILEPAVISVLEHPVILHIKMWHGFNPALIMSLTAILGGSLVYCFRKKMFSFQEKISPGIYGNVVYDRIIQFLMSGADLLTKTLQSKKLRNYFWINILFILLATSTPLLFSENLIQLSSLNLPPLGFFFLGVLFIVATLGVLYFHQNRFLAFLCLSFVGSLISLIFIRVSAPDLALTQISVEICLLVAILLVLFFLPKEEKMIETKMKKLSDGLLSIAAGLGIMFLLWGSLSFPFNSISKFHIQNSFTQAGGRNIVNVILVDFRGFDTLGEIMVLGIAALGILALLRQRKLFR